MVQNYVKPTNLENHLTKFFSKFWKLGWFSKWEMFFWKKKLGKFSKLAPKIKTDNSHKKVKIAKHWWVPTLKTY